MTTPAKALLWLGVEDYTGLWEAAAEVATVVSGVSRDEARAEAARLLWDFVQRGWVTLHLCEEPLGVGTITDVHPDNVGELLTLDVNWEPPTRSVTIRYSTTEEGEQACSHG